jgi:hypothetical protein
MVAAVDVEEFMRNDGELHVGFRMKWTWLIIAFIHPSITATAWQIYHQK